jgi:hypothetical protein
MALTDVEIFDLNNELTYKSAFLSINTDQIIWVLPVEDEISEGNEDNQ